MFNLLLIMHPSEMIGAAKDGINLWFNNVMPSLVPFIIGVNILSGLGVIDFIGALLTPVMRPLFGVPGAGGFALVTSFTSGYPVGAKVIATLRNEGKITQIEAQRLISFCNNSGPLFVLGAVGSGMLNDVRAGYFILASHYISAVLTGLIFRFYKRGKERLNCDNSVSLETSPIETKNYLNSLGQILGDSVKNAMEAVTVVGGFIILFCAFSRALELSGANAVFVNALANVMPGIGRELSNGLFFGIFEITNGARILSDCEFSMWKYILLAAVISFGGLSINAQAINFLSKTDIKLSVYLVSKLIHSSLAVAVGMVLFPYFNLSAVAAFSSTDAVKAFAFYDSFTDVLTISTTVFVASLIFLLIVSLMAYSGSNRLKNRKKF